MVGLTVAISVVLMVALKAVLMVEWTDDSKVVY